MAAFDAGALTSDGGGLLLRHTDRALGLIERVAACFQDNRKQDQVVPTLPTLVGQRIVGIALGGACPRAGFARPGEDVKDHDELRHDPVLALLADRLEPKRSDCAPLAGKSTLNRLEHAPLRPDDRYHKIGHDPAALAHLFVDHRQAALEQAPMRQALVTSRGLHLHQRPRAGPGPQPADPGRIIAHAQMPTFTEVMGIELTLADVHSDHAFHLCPIPRVRLRRPEGRLLSTGLRHPTVRAQKKSGAGSR